MITSHEKGDGPTDMRGICAEMGLQVKPNAQETAANIYGMVCIIILYIIQTQ